MGTWRLRFEVGGSGIAPGGGIRAQLPDSWHMGERMTAKPVHSADPRALNFVSGSCSRPKSRLQVGVEGGQTEATKINRLGLDGRSGRYVYVVCASVDGDPLEPGDTIDLVFGERSGGSAGFAAPGWCDGPEEILVSVDSAGLGTYESLRGGSTAIEIRSGAHDELVVTGPSSLVVGDDASLHLAVLDRYGNRCSDFEGVIKLQVPPSVRIPSSVSFGPEDSGIQRIPFRAEQPGILRLRASIGDRLEASSNPIECVAGSLPYQLYWAELHSHGHRSFDAVGRSNFVYAKDVAALDVFALTDHCEGWPDDTWEWLRTEVGRRYEPGRFVTILAYEATFGSPWGHHNVYFPGLDGVVRGADQGTLLDLFGALEGYEALVVPHHTGVCWGGAEGNVPSPTGGTPNPDWKYHDPRLRRLIEIYSGHGQSERCDPLHRLSYENARYDLATSSEGPHYAWDAWGCGHVLGVLASSDNHNGQPGRGELGLTGIWATELTREAIYEALRERRTFATTGARILLDFSVNGVRMGGTAIADGPLSARIRAHGTEPIDTVEILVGDTASGQFAVAERWAPDTADFEVDWTCDPPSGNALYYVRLSQCGTYRGRARMAWSSPVWVSSGEAAAGATSAVV